MESIAESINAAIEFPIDFEGQKQAKVLLNRSLAVGVVASLFAGIFTNSIYTLVYSFGASIAIAALATLPAWPSFKRNPQSFLKVKYDL